MHQAQEISSLYFVLESTLGCSKLEHFTFFESQVCLDHFIHFAPDTGCSVGVLLSLVMTLVEMSVEIEDLNMRLYLFQLIVISGNQVLDK